MMGVDVTLLSAFVAGLVSFLSPCVLPLVPGYISMLSGVGVEQLRKGEGAKGILFSSALAFVTGFSVVFISLGASASSVGQFLRHNKSSLAPVAGAMILLFGLHLIGWLAKIPISVGAAIGVVLVSAGLILMRAPGALAGKVEPIQFFALSVIFLFGPLLSQWLSRDVHFRNLGGQPGAVGGFLMGFAFAFGWTPCIGPIFAAVLLVAASRETIWQGIFLLAAYSAGLAVPFLLTALGVNRFLGFYQRFRRHLHTVEVLSGVLLLFVGALVFTNRFTWLSGKLAFLNRFML
ncbi:MAG TPA: cytochrome c biogenesis protein CcdA [Candidatus Acidoferrum sp.]|nr:cytochrome c biogenesis protein CcdA [Candidatus Acidoferrum sp.]